jgi:hypothetical protein
MSKRGSTDAGLPPMLRGRRPNKHSRRVDASSATIVPKLKGVGTASQHEWTGPSHLSLIDMVPEEVCCMPPSTFGFAWPLDPGASPDTPTRCTLFRS